MTLSKQTFFILIGALITLFIGTFFITVYQSKLYFEEQLQRNAQDTATALGLSLSAELKDKTDTATILGKVNAVFDRGHLKSIVVYNTNNEIIITRRLKTRSLYVPNWFRKLISIETAKKSAFIQSGWQQVGKVSVQSGSELAYLALWETVLKLFLLFLALTLIISIISMLLIRATFYPLKRIIQQARDIGRKNFYEIKQKPTIQELKELSNAINHMVKKLKTFFDYQIEEVNQLKKKSYLDNLTGLGNRRYFFQQLNHLLLSEEAFSPGYLLLVKLSGLESLNEAQGYFEGDKLLKAYAETLSDSLNDKNQNLLARLDGPTFAAIIHEPLQTNLDIIMSSLANELCAFLKKKDHVSCDIGVVDLQFSEDPAQLLIRADRALQHSSQQQEKHFYIDLKTDSVMPYSRQKWHQLINNALKEQTFSVYAQPVQTQGKIYHRECFLKLKVDGQEISATEFMPVAEAYDLSGAIDHFLLQTILQQSLKEAIAINLSAATAATSKYHTQLIDKLETLSTTSREKIHFELSEQIFTYGGKEAKSLITQLTELGFRVGLDKVGATLTSFNHLKNLNLAYLKLDGSFAKDLKDNTIKQELILNLLSISTNLDMILIATSIESESQLKQFQGLGITYYQGHYIQSPSYFDLK